MRYIISYTFAAVGRLRTVWGVEGEGVRNTLLISGVSRKDFGPYNCTVNNVFGGQWALVTLREKGGGCTILPSHILLRARQL